MKNYQVVITMKKYKFNKLLKQSKTKFDYEMILKNHLFGYIYLTSKQLDKILKKRGEKKYPHYVIKEGRQVIIW